MNNSQSWKTNVSTLLQLYYMYMHVLPINLTVVLVIAGHWFSYFYTPGVCGVTIISTSNQYYSHWRRGQAWTSSGGWGLSLSISPEQIDVRMQVFFSVILCVDNTEQEQNNHKKNMFLFSYNPIRIKYLHTFFLQSVNLRLFLSDDNSSAKEENVQPSLPVQQ